MHDAVGQPELVRGLEVGALLGCLEGRSEGMRVCAFGVFEARFVVD